MLSMANECGFRQNRGMNLQMNIQPGMIAQSEENLMYHHCELKLVQLSKLIESMEKLIKLKLKMVDEIGNSDSSSQFNMSINILMKIKCLNGKFKQFGSVLDQAAMLMGLQKRDDKANGDKDDSFVASVIRTD